MRLLLNAPQILRACPYPYTHPHLRIELGSFYADSPVYKLGRFLFLLYYYVEGVCILFSYGKPNVCSRCTRKTNRLPNNETETSQRAGTITAFAELVGMHLR